MILHSCCEAAPSWLGSDPLTARSRNPNPQRRSFTRASLDVVRVMVPGAMLALMPKCPACLAAYVVIGTGVGLSLSAASYLRMLLVTLCVAWLSYFAAVRGRRLIGWTFSRTASNSESVATELKRSLE